MVCFPPCKINLGLNVVSRRSDGYHNIETCFYPVPWTDILEIIPSQAFLFQQSGLPVPGDASDNLCVKAYHSLRERFQLPPVSIHLHKVIPTGAGLGGGSSDGAWTLRTLNTLFDLGLTAEGLSLHAAGLGSDCGFFLHDQPMLGSGRGDILTPVNVDLRGMFMAIAKPEVHVSTAEAYAQVTPRAPGVALAARLQGRQPAEWDGVVKNDFEEVIARRYPEVAAIREMMRSAGAVYTAMSGSGSAVYGIFQTEPRMLSLDGLAHWTGRL